MSLEMTKEWVGFHKASNSRGVDRLAFTVPKDDGG
jgi:hypothetical protein